MNTRIIALLVVIAVIALLVVRAVVRWWFLTRSDGTENKSAQNEAKSASSKPKPAARQKPVESPATPHAEAKPKQGLSLDDLIDPSTLPSHEPVKVKSNSSTPIPTTMQEPPLPPQPTASVGPGEFEKALAHAGQRMDSLSTQAQDLTRQLKLSEKTRAEAIEGLKKATDELTTQLQSKDEEISKLGILLDQKASFPSLRSLIEVKKLCQDMLGTQKPLSHDDLIKFVSEAIDDKLSGLDVQVTNFDQGTPLERIPAEQVENSPRFEATQDPAQVNQVARQLRPCYYLERDAKRIIIVKASVILYRLTPTPPGPESTSTTPSSL